ncbi:MAG: 3-hydroxyacyl-CoA dehydrogenase NAD-binding domain-containing protein [Alphaproteobacteria bacterium]
MTKTIQHSLDKDGIATLTIDVPDHSLNVMTEEFMLDLDGLVDRIVAEDKIKGVIICSGKDNGFVAGADIPMINELVKLAKTGDVEKTFAEQFKLNQLFRKIETCGKPFVAAVNGLTLGGGFELALCCHYRIVADDPKVKIGFPEVMLGILPGAGGTQRLPRLAGILGALLPLTTGKNFSAKEIVGAGVFQEIVAKDQLLIAAKKWLMESPDPVAPWDKKGFKFPGGSGAMHPGAVQTFIGANAMAQQKTMHNYPAVEAILSCVYEGGIVPFDKGIEIESKYFTKLLMGPEAGNMIRTLFLNKQAAEKGMARPSGVPEMKTKKLGILGAGMMGAGVAYVSARAGMEVVLLDRDIPSAEKGKDYSTKLIEKGIRYKKTTEAKGKVLLDLIKTTDKYEDLAGCDLIIEAVFEDPKIKADVIKKTEAVISKDTIFASNTSTLPITGLAKNSRDESQFIGIHFFSPVEKMMLVEIILGKKTGDKAIAKALDYARQIKKTPIVVHDSRGFYTSRCFGTYVQEGVAMVREGVKPALIENAGKMAGMPVGPLAVGDEVSIELMYKIQKATEAGLGKDYVANPADEVAAKMVEKFGRLGRKSGAGFYDYPEGAKKHLWLDLAKHYPVSDEQPGVDEVIERLLYRQAIECARCFDEGVLQDVQSGDVGAIFGWGFAPYSGGPFSFIDNVGAKAFVKTAEGLAKKHGERFAPPEGLKKMADGGATYYP